MLCADLMGNVGSRFTDIPVHFSHYADMLITIQKGMLLVSDVAGSPCVRGLVCFQAGVGQDNDEPLCIFVGRRNGGVLIRNKFRQFRRGT